MNIKLVSSQNIAEISGFDGGFLVTRSNGQEYISNLYRILQDLPEDIPLVLDLSAVKVIDASFADEVFGTLATQRAQKKLSGSPLVLSGLSSDHLPNVEYALQTRTMRIDGLRNCVLPLLKSENAIELIGKMENHVRETFNYVAREKTVTARSLADKMNLSIAASSTRLKTLYDLGLVVREEIRDETGKQFTYNYPQ